MSNNYVTTNIRLPKEMLKTLKLKAAQEDKSIAQLIREAIKKAFAKKEKLLSREELKKDPFFKTIGMFDDGIKDGSIHHDRDIYGSD